MFNEVNYTVHAYSYTIYVEKATNFIKMQDTYISVETSVQGEKRTAMGIQMTYRYKYINKQVDIQLPEEAKNAETMNQ